MLGVEYFRALGELDDVRILLLEKYQNSGYLHISVVRLPFRQDLRKFFLLVIRLENASSFILFRYRFEVKTFLKG